MFFSIPWIYIIDISGFYFEEYMLGYLTYVGQHPAPCCLTKSRGQAPDRYIKEKYNESNAKNNRN